MTVICFVLFLNVSRQRHQILKTMNYLPKKVPHKDNIFQHKSIYKRTYISKFHDTYITERYLLLMLQVSSAGPCQNSVLDLYIYFMTHVFF